jgi:DNA-binding MarR family transcriptional regulator
MIVTIHDNHSLGLRSPVMSVRPTRYADSLAFLLSQVGAQSARLFAEALAPLEVSPRAFAVLSNLGANDGQTQQQLADALGIHRNNMVGLVDALEAAGWLQRHRNAHDRRAFSLRLTPAGHAIVAQVNDLIPQLDAQLGHGLEPAQRRELVALLKQTAEALGLSPSVHPHLAGRPR